MSALDIVLLIFIGCAVIGAFRFALKKKKNGGCSGCSGCSGGCNSCNVCVKKEH